MSYTRSITIISDSTVEFAGRKIDLYEIESIHIKDGKIHAIAREECERCGRGGETITEPPEPPERLTMSDAGHLIEIVRWADVKHLYEKG
jgi:hypothetical protein